LATSLREHSGRFGVAGLRFIAGGEVQIVKFALQSIVWGHQVSNIREMLSQAFVAGYRGIELFQDIEDSNFGGATGLHQAFRDCKMSLVGVASGSMSERVEFVKEYCRLLGVKTTHSQAPYIYVDEWDGRCDDALGEGIRLGLHPHMFRPIQTMHEAMLVLDRFDMSRFPQLQLLPDTAHSTIAGDDPVEVVKACFDRIGAVHLKDWTPIVGRSYQFYASGFCGLGDGTVRLREVLDVLWKRSYRGWVVVEHDFSSSPETSIKTSFDWLQEALPPKLFSYLMPEP
jgi:sugar phosphate isomerase/epimerase